jgi:lipoate-protein ligase A
MSPETWYRLDSGAGDPAWNMAMDEVLLSAVAGVGAPILRFYGWRAPAATFGYFQHHADVELMTSLRPLVRRMTGGGLVPHDADWTYCLVFPPAHEWYRLRAGDSYRRLHEWIRDSFARLGLATELAPCCAKELPGRCFAGPEKFDLLWQGRKVAGAAQRRAKEGLMIQGSVQPVPPGIDRGRWEQALADAASASWGIRWASLPERGRLEDFASSLATAKYATDAHNRRR